MSVAPEEAAVPVADAPQYRYLQEISQMVRRAAAGAARAA
jgi:hypothetical protein